MNFIIWIILGACAGWVAGRLMKGSDYGFVVNAILGIVGSFVGGWLFGFLGISAGGDLGSFVTAIVGAMAVIFIANFINKNRPK
jgi:uncharacterized membrane protein YeaQ/YmgE (transglycosylase-associated protein family)